MSSSRPAIQRLSSVDSPPPVTTQWTCGCGASLLAPVPQRREHADFGAEVFRVRGHLKEGFRGSPHQQAVHHAGVGQRRRLVVLRASFVSVT